MANYNWMQPGTNVNAYLPPEYSSVKPGVIKVEPCYRWKFSSFSKRKEVKIDFGELGEKWVMCSLVFKAKKLEAE